MTRSRVCPDTESTGLSPASDALPVRETAEPFAQAVFGKSLSLLTPEERFTTVYTGSRDRSVDRHPAGWFPAGTWFYHERRACGGLCRTSSGRATVSRFRNGTAAGALSATPATGPGEQLLTRTALLKAGYSRATMAAMTPVAGRQNRHSGDRDPLYRVQTETRDDSGEKT